MNHHPPRVSVVVVYPTHPPFAPLYMHCRFICDSLAIVGINRSLFFISTQAFCLFLSNKEWRGGATRHRKHLLQCPIIYKIITITTTSVCR